MSKLKQEAIEIIKSLPENDEVDDILEAFITKVKIEEGLADIDAGNLVPHDEVVRRFGL